ncbi:hypothetical protein ALC57_07858 [Trachymyrmex cornetzi]|uniref:Uncharacterized protein n=1 Tax=Trachymyrmex cornetzi TaxID=471704 RepID=A0A195E4I2_9HYME|nr:hypothetical protein ALC57_07858 [Trachymyrmex cornetzi]
MGRLTIGFRETRRVGVRETGNANRTEETERGMPGVGLPRHWRC